MHHARTEAEHPCWKTLHHSVWMFVSSGIFVICLACPVFVVEFATTFGEPMFGWWSCAMIAGFSIGLLYHVIVAINSAEQD